jgi:hypothetical protein
MPNDIKVLDHNNYKLIIQFKDNIIFEQELINKNIYYYKDEKSIINFRYFFLCDDSETIDLILKKNTIAANIESLPINDFNQEKKLQLMYIKVAVVVIIIIILIGFIF